MRVTPHGLSGVCHGAVGVNDNTWPGSDPPPAPCRGVAGAPQDGSRPRAVDGRATVGARTRRRTKNFAGCRVVRML
jgi:hypothetical protein